LLLTTGNKSELAVGYATIYGDMAGGFAPLKDVLKTEVYALAKWRNKLSSIIPHNIITRAPSAELRDNQTDQDTLPEYEVLDKLIQGIVEENLSSQDLTRQGFFPDDVALVSNLIKTTEYKRSQSTLGPKISKRGFGKDWRYPVTNGYKY
jgi:NAD+ synthase (glutamine-hydrolysing)